MRADLTDQLADLIPRLRRFATGLTGDRDSGDELVQVACERLLRAQENLRADTKLDSWMYRVIRNLFIDGVREQSVRERGAREIRRTAELYVVSNDSVEKQMRLREVQDAMQQLSEEHRSTLMLICVEGLSYKEAAEVMQVPIGTVASRLIRARKSLIDRIGNEVEDAGVEVSS